MDTTDSTDPTIQQLLKIIEFMGASERAELLEELIERQRGTRRKTPRRAYNEIIDYSDGDKFFRDMSKNLSEGGIMIATPQSFAVGQTLTIVIPFWGQGGFFQVRRQSGVG